MGASIHAHLRAITEELGPEWGNATVDVLLVTTTGKVLRYFPTMQGDHAFWSNGSAHTEFTADKASIVSDCRLYRSALHRGDSRGYRSWIHPCMQGWILLGRSRFNICGFRGQKVAGWCRIKEVQATRCIAIIPYARSRLILAPWRNPVRSDRWLLGWADSRKDCRSALWVCWSVYLQFWLNERHGQWYRLYEDRAKAWHPTY